MSFVTWILWMTTIGTLWLPTTNGNGQWFMTPCDLWGFWYMDKPIVAYNYTNETFTFNYKLNMTAGVSVTENLRADIFTSDCETHVGAAEGVIFEIINSEGEHVFRMDYPTVSNVEELFTITSNSTARADYCLRFSMWTGPESNPNAKMVNWIDCLLIIYFKMDGAISVDFLVEKVVGFGGHSKVFEEETYDAIGYLCDPETREPLVFDNITQGTVISTCVELDEVALDQGLVIDIITSFYWIRNYDTYNVTQDIYLNGDVIDVLSVGYCFSGMTHCHFDTLLKADFYRSPGQVRGYGQLLMKFPSTSRRQLQHRALQDDSSLWREQGGMSMNVTVAIYDEPIYQRRTAGGVPAPTTVITNIANILVTMGIWILLN